MAAEPAGPPAACIRVLLLEDSDIDAELANTHLYKAGLQYTLERAHDRASFMAMLAEMQDFDVVLADYSLPGFDGLTALDMVRERAPGVPFIFVSGVVGEEFAIAALRRGATDYVMKRGLNRLPAAVDRAVAEARERAERQRAQEALRLSELGNQLAVDIAGLGQWQLEIDSQRLMLDARCRELFGFAPREPLTLHLLLQTCHPEDRARVAGAMRQVIGNENAKLAIEYRIERRSDGAERWLSTSAQCYFEDGKCLRLVGVVVDITNRKQDETALQEMNQTLQLRVAQRTAERDQLWQLSQDLFAVVNRDGVIIEANPAWTLVLGYPLDEIVGSSYVQYVHPDDVEHAALRLSHLVHDTLKSAEDRLRHKDGGYRWISWSAAPGESGAYAVGRDITEDKEAAARLVEAQDALRQSQKMEAVGQLTGGVAHDFNNLLQVVVGNLETLCRKLPEDAQRLRRAADHAMEGARRAANLTQRLLAFSRRQPLNPRAVEVNRLVTGMSELLQRTLGELIQVTTRLDQNLWRAAVDENQLENALLNLAVNARDAMPEGGRLTIETRNVSAEDPRDDDDLPQGDCVALFVTDNGTGMPPEVLAHAFEPFFTTKAVGQGTGLGLSQVYGFVKQSGGQVKIASTPGAGTSVRIFLPRLVGLFEPPPEQREHEPQSVMPRETVLVVEDDDGVRAYTMEVVRELGYRVYEARDGRAAIRLLQNPAVGPVDLLFTDVVLPGGMNGQQLAQQAVLLRPGIKVLFATGYARDVIVHDGRLDAGVQLINKPFGYNDLAAKLRSVIDGEE